ncbi:MAG: aldose 1-epimerase family protein [Clostridia bacterium]|nr:aldose 1-epimerase family protein [Clostridia bacterium]
MIYKIKKGGLSIQVKDVGAELLSVMRNGCEFLWQGDPVYWADRAPVLFPICGRLYGGHYTYRGTTYEIPSNGFAQFETFRLSERKDDRVTLVLDSNENTRSCYPFDFCLSITYRLTERMLEVACHVENRGAETLLFAFGAHPGFRVPLAAGTEFSDYSLVFPAASDLHLLNFTDTGFDTGTQTPYPLKDGKQLSLRHSLFDIDSLFFEGSGGVVTLCSEKTGHRLSVHYPDFPYLGIWHAPRTQAPYLCIEPWAGLPSINGKIDDFEEKKPMFHLAANETKTLFYAIEVIAPIEKDGATN